MNPKYFGDSYDIVKRFFCGVLRDLEYQMYVDPMFTGDWSEEEDGFFEFIGASQLPATPFPGSSSVLFLDPDTGVRATNGRQHVSFSRLVREAQHHAIVFAFDQSFSRGEVPRDIMKQKMAALENLGCHAMYYDSHARFLFVSQDVDRLTRLRDHLMALGLPKSRLLTLENLLPIREAAANLPQD